MGEHNNHVNIEDKQIKQAYEVTYQFHPYYHSFICIILPLFVVSDVKSIQNYSI